MLDELLERIRKADSARVYRQTVTELSEYLYEIGKPEEAQKLTGMAALRENRFSKRESEEDLKSAKEAVIEFCDKLQKSPDDSRKDIITEVLMNSRYSAESCIYRK